jgi:hypothetical protein
MERPSRGASRFLAGLPAELCYHGRAYPCTAHNLSRTGVLLRGSIPWPSDDVVEVAVTSGSGDLELRVRGRVRRVDVEETEEGRSLRIGIEFREIDDDRRSVLEALVARVVEGVSPASIGSLPPDASREQIRDALDKIPLAHKIALASRGEARERELLANDPSPQVIEAIARNPKVLPKEVMNLLRLPHILPSTLEILGRDTRLAQNEEVRILVASHPKASLTLARSIANELTPEGQARLLRRPSVHPTVRNELGRPAKGPRR